MNVSSLLGSPSRQSITTLLLWYRIITVAHVAVLLLIGVKATPILPLIFAITYNALVLIYNAKVIKNLEARPYLILIDVFISFLLILNSGGYKSPYYLYSFSPVVLGSFLFGYPGAFIIAGAQSVLFVAAIYANGSSAAIIASSGEHVITDFFFFTLVGISVAYLKDLLDELTKATAKKAIVNGELEEAKRCLELSLKASVLSDRESQVIVLSSSGRTREEIASELGVSGHTVKTYLERAYKKLNASSRHKAISQISGRKNNLE